MKAKNSIWILTALLSLSGCAKNDQEEQELAASDATALVSYYSFDAQNADDGISGCDGIPFGDVKFVTDTPSGTGYAASLNGYKTGFINIPYNVFAGKTSYSIALWMKDFDFGTVISAISSDGPRADFPSFNVASYSKFYLRSRYDNWNDTPDFEYDIFNLKASGWHHVAVTCEPIDVLNHAKRQLYIDGKLVVSDTDAVQAYYNVHGYAEDIITKVQMGGNRNGDYAQCMTMVIDNVRFYLKAISPQTVQELYKGKM